MLKPSPVALFLIALAGATPAFEALAWERPAAAIPVPQDRDFRGALQLDVDATDTRHRVIRVRERVPVQAAGRMTLLYPRWEAASHAPTIEAQRLAGLMIRAADQPVSWRRDPLDPNAFHVEVPTGVKVLDLEFQYLAPLGPVGPVTAGFVNVQWQNLVLYPAGWFARRIEVVPQLRLPEGFTVASGLQVHEQAAQTTRFQPVSLERLLDSPVVAGRTAHRRQIDAGPVPVSVTYLADDAAELTHAASLDEPLRAVVDETRAVFGPSPFPRFEFIVALTERLPGPGGVEHGQSTEIVLPPDFLSKPGGYLLDVDLLAHEYVHAWNGKFAQPADLWTPTPNEPMQDSLMWLYEGQTEFWGRVLTTRSGLRTAQDTLAALAMDAAAMANRPGRRWKNLEDSAHDPLTMAGGRPVQWRDWQRREDYYTEGVLLWLDIDGLLRERSGGRYGLDDFARRFFAPNGTPSKLYSFNDVCKTLSALVPMDWSGHLTRRLRSHDDADLLTGLDRAGYRLVYADTPTPVFKQAELNDGVRDFSYSIGLTVNDKGVIRAVGWESVAYRAGLVPGARIKQVGTDPFDGDRLAAAIAERRADGIPITVEVEGKQETMTLPYDGGLRYPALARIPGRADGLLSLFSRRR